MSAGQQGRELQLEIGIVPLIREHGCKRVVWRVKHLPSSEREPSTFEKRMVQYCCIRMGWIGGVWIVPVALSMQTYSCIAGVHCGCERGHNFGIRIPLDLQFMHIYDFVKYTGDSKWYIFCINTKSN